MKNNQPLVSIIIVSLNRKSDLSNCIESLNSQTYKNYEVLLIDNNSEDGSTEFIKSKFPSTKVYKTFKNLGTSYTRNAGVKFSKGELIWFLDSDVYLKDDNVLFNLIEKFTSENEIDGIGGEAILNDKDEIIGTKKLILYPNGMTKGYLDTSNQKSKVKIITTCNLLIKKKIIEDVGGFDHFYFFYLEDIDLTFRIYKKGYKIYLMEKCPVIHYFSETARLKNHFIAKRNRIYFIIKNFNIFNIFILPFYDLFYILSLDNLKRIFRKIFQDYKIENHNIKILPKKFSFINILYTLKITTIIILSMIFSYLYIPYFLIKHIMQKNIKINFLELIKKEDFILIKNKNNS